METIDTLHAIQWEIAREREQGRTIDRVHVSSHGLEASVVSVPRVTLRGRHREVLVHPRDWERLLTEIREQGPVERVLGLPIEHSA